MNPENDLKSLWAAAKDSGLTLGDAVVLLEQKGFGTWGTSTVKATVEGKSKEFREKVLRKVLQEHLGFAESVNDGRAESATTGVAIHDRAGEYESIEQCRQRIKELEADNERLRAMVHAAAAPISYRKGLSEAQVIAKRAGDAHDARPKK